MKSWPWYAHLVLAVAIVGVFFLFYYRPQQSKIAGLRADRVKVEAELKTLREQKARLDKIEAEMASMRATLKNLETIVPQKKEIAEILRRIQQLAYDSRLNVTRFEEKGEINRDFYSEWPFPVVTSGTFHSLGMFYDSLAKLPRLFTVEAFDVKSLTRQTDALTVNATWTARTYTFNEEPAPDAKAKAAPAGKKKPGPPGAKR